MGMKEEREAFYKRLNASGELTNKKGYREAEASTISYLAKNEEKAKKKIKGRPIIMFPTDKTFQSNIRLSERYYSGLYVYEEEEKEQDR